MQLLDCKITMSDGHVYHIKSDTPENAAILGCSEAIKLQRKRYIRKMETHAQEGGSILYEKVGVFVVYDDME